MSGYIFQEFVRDFAERTKQNMNVINSIYNDHPTEPEKKVYEVTQMINSLFGMIIVPYEKYNKIINEAEYSDDSSYKQIQGMIKDLKQQRFLRSTYYKEHDEVSVFEFIGHLRNALAHSGNGRLNFYPVTNKNDNIKAVYFMDKYEYTNGGLCYFVCRISVNRIKKLCELIPALYETIEKSVPDSERAEIFNQYNEHVLQMNSFLNGESIDGLNNLFQ